MYKTRKRRWPGRPRSLATFDPQTARWLLRTLARSSYPAYDVELLGRLGVRVPKGHPDEEPERAAVHAAIVSRLEKLEASVSAPSLAASNAALLGGSLGLSPIEIELLALTIAFEAEQALGSCFAALHIRNFADTAKHIAAVLGLRAREVAHALRRDGALRELRLVHLTRMDHPDSGPLALGNAVSPVLLQPLAEERDLLGHFLDDLAPSTLTLDDFSHVAHDVDLLRRLLAAALAARQSGVNVLLYGAPGTGKTELARALAGAIGARLAAVKLSDASDDLLDGAERLENHALCQRMLRGQDDVLLLFDEAEDAFPCGSWLTQAKSGRHKAWTNRLLEQNPVPTLWISNLIDHIDRAFVRRFDLVLELAAPPRSVRRRVLERHLGPFGLQPSTLSAWVGETEKNIARMFAHAAADRGVILLDEADSLLAERSRARNAWEITQVNEMLAQMEHFDGIFICSTNLMDNIDHAALRRFAIKVRFDFMRPAQIEQLFKTLAADADGGDAVRDACRLAKLTPGDFAAVMRKLRMLRITPTSAELLRALREELAHKRERGGSIGFGT